MVRPSPVPVLDGKHCPHVHPATRERIDVVRIDDITEDLGEGAIFPNHDDDVSKSRGVANRSTEETRLPKTNNSMEEHPRGRARRE